MPQRDCFSGKTEWMPRRSEPRFKIISVTGYAEMGGVKVTLYSVVDSCYCWCEIYSLGAHQGSQERRRKLTRAMCARLNYRDRQEYPELF